MTFQLKIRNKIVAGLIIISSTLLASNFIGRQMTYSLTPSLSHRLFILNRNVDLNKIKDGDIVRFPFSDSFTGGKVYLLKRVGCVPGELLTADRDKNYFCGQRWLGHAKSMSSKGVPVASFKYTGEVPPGKFFAIADHKDSYDSRYIGFIDISSIEAKAYPVF